MLQKDISSRKLYVTANEIVYKFSRPSILFWRVTTIEKRAPLSLVIDIIIEQGCLQSFYGLHTFRIESIAHGKAAPVDELRVQGVTDPGVLRKVIITEALKNLQDLGKGCEPTLTGEEESLSRVGSLSEGRVIFKSPTKSWKITGSPRYTSLEHRGLIQGEMLLNKLEEVSKSVKVWTVYFLDVDLSNKAVFKT
ncbi:hypothetical protein OIU85_011546 [Salix viminalis]|uniref:DUF7642 domain-containing protein n=1 Tax=Salix viminalis TaxID=40686 RepID=A0A9Q0NT05_SALVM|nr:hypothetical protein OIU85_011546 [Salix viminalis]